MPTFSFSDNPAEIKQAFQRHGYVIFQDVISREQCEATIYDCLQWSPFAPFRRDGLQYNVPIDPSSLSHLASDMNFKTQGRLRFSCGQPGTRALLENVQTPEVVRAFSIILEGEDVQDLHTTDLIAAHPEIQILRPKIADEPQTAKAALLCRSVATGVQVSDIYGFKTETEEDAKFAFRDVLKNKLVQGILTLTSTPKDDKVGGFCYSPKSHLGAGKYHVSKCRSLPQGSLLVFNDLLEHAFVPNDSILNYNVLQHIRMVQRGVFGHLWQPLEVCRTRYPYGFKMSKLGEKIFGILPQTSVSGTPDSANDSTQVLQRIGIVFLILFGLYIFKHI